MSALSTTKKICLEHGFTFENALSLYNDFIAKSPKPHEESKISDNDFTRQIKVETNRVFKNWIIVNKVDKKSEREEKFRFKIIRGKKIDSRMRTIRIVKSVNVFEQGNL